MNHPAELATVFLTGGSGYLGQRLIPRLLQHGYTVRALVRKQSQHKLPPGCQAVIGDALDNRSYRDRVAPAQTYVHLVGVSHPSPWKAEQFRRVDLVSVQQALEAALQAGIRHFIYASVAHPAPVMKSYIEVRSECEALIEASGLPATILRPWYVLGPGHWWPYALKPVYALLERIPATAEVSRRLGLVTVSQMTGTLVRAVQNPAAGRQVIEVPEIRLNSKLESQIHTT